MTSNEEAPGMQAEGFEITNSIPYEEKTMNTQSTPTPNCDTDALADLRERALSQRAAWLREHPEVMAMKPEWAETVDVDDIDSRGSTDVWFERLFGPVRLSKRAEYEPSGVTWDDDSDAPSVHIEHEWTEGLTVERMRELASALMAAIPVVEAATA